jgi:hypothetical protein
VLDSSCGERLLIGRFGVTVQNGKVAEIVARNDSAGPTLRGLGPGVVPTLGELLDELDTARLEKAERAEVTFDPVDSHPTHIEIDWLIKAIDDEACYLISEYSVAY